MQKQKLTEKLHRWARLTVAMIAVGTMVVHDGWAQVVDDDYVLEQNPFEKGNGDNQYLHIGFITEVAMSNNSKSLKDNGYHVVRFVPNGTTGTTIDDVDSKNENGHVYNTKKVTCYFGYKTSQESDNDNIYELFYKSNERPISWPEGYTYIGNLSSRTNEFKVDPPGAHFDYTAVLGTIRRNRTKEHWALASPLAIMKNWKYGGNKYPNGCNKANDDTDETRWEGPFVANARDNWDLAFCNAISKPAQLDKHMMINAEKGYLSFFKYVPQFDGYNSQKSSVAIVMHRKDPSTGNVVSELIFKQDFAKEEDTESGSWADENPDVVGNETGKFKVYHGMKQMAKYKDETMAKWDEWRIYFEDGTQYDAENLSFTVYQVHDHVLQYRTFSMQLAKEEVNQVDPYINIDASSSGIGSIVKTLIFTNTVKYKQLKNKTTGYTIMNKTESNEGTMVTFILPPTDDPVEYEAILWCHSSYDNAELIEHHVTFTTPIFHTIENLAVSVNYDLDSCLIMHPKSVVHWQVKNPEVEDILSEDQFLVFRANKADFSDEVCVYQASFRKDGIYEYSEKIEDIDFTTSGEDHKVYYRVTRALVYANWHDDEGGYGKSGEIVYPLSLPQVTNVSVEKTRGFDTDHKVIVRVELDNPWNNTSEDPVVGSEYVLRDSIDQLILMFSSDRCELTSNTNAPDRFTYLGNNDKSLFANQEGHKMQMNAEGYLTFAERETTDKFEAKKNDSGNYTIRYFKNGERTPMAWLRQKEEEDCKYVVAGSDSLIRWSFVPGENLHRKYRWDPNASIIITRSGYDKHNTTVDDAGKTIIVPGNKVQWDNQKKCYYVEVNDVQTFGYTYYYYSATVDRGSSTYLMPKNPEVLSSWGDAAECYTETMAPLTNLTATCGETARPDGICLEWQIEDNTHLSYQVQRSLHGKNNWSKPTKLEGTEIHYLDKECQIGEVYDYKLTAQLEFHNNIYSKEYQITGCRGYYGSISGAITMPNGQHMPGSVRVTLKATQNISYSAVEGYRAAASVKAGETVVQTTTDGTFHFEHVLLDRENTKYKVSVAFDDDRNVNFENPAGGSNEFEVTMNRDLTEYTGCNYVCKDTYRYSGRVLYQGTTIPVRDVQFTFNDKVIMGANGQPVATDQKGNFSFDVPRAQATVAARMEGHTLLNEGKIKNKEGQDTFTPTSDLEGLQLWDQTTVRLVGRLVGGNKQGQLPLGFGASTNNLGDDLKLVLELEGDDTALMVYDEKNPEVISRDGMEYSQEVKFNNGNTELVDKTIANFKKHRIEIYPNIETGEFCIDLFPVKYKISELSAKGYATLYNQGEGMEVLDLSDAAANVQTAEYITNNKKTTQYNATYNRIYHSPVYGRFTQYRYGLKQNWYGAEKMDMMNLDGETRQAILSSYDKETQETYYAFGYPVFCQGQKYTMEAYVYEKYYYNGETGSSRADSCMLDTEATLIVNNGFVSNESRITLPINEQGKATFTFSPSNADFTNTGENNLRTLRAQVLVNDLYYDIDGIQAYVTGSRKKGNDAQSVVDSADGEINVFDVIRDPYGAKSYAWRESGTKYHFEAKRTLSWGLSPTFTISNAAESGGHIGYFIGIASPGGAGALSGAWQGKTQGASTALSFEFSIPSSSLDYYHEVKYDMTINEKVTTSAESNMIGARADVYIGLVNTYALTRNETFYYLDDESYDLLQPSIEAGSVRIVQEGKDAMGKNCYLAIGESFTFGASAPREFMYTQQYIINQLIPDLWQQYKSSIYTGSHNDVQAMANGRGEILFRLKDDKSISDADCYEVIKPENDMADPEITPEHYLNSIIKWGEVIANNESKKLAAMSNGQPYLAYDISSGLSVNHSEALSWSDNEYEDYSILGISLGARNWEPELKAALKEHEKESGKELNADSNDEENSKKTSYKIQAPSYEWDFSIDPGWETNYTSSTNCLTTYTATTGYYLEAGKDGQLMQDVYRLAPGHWYAEKPDAEDEDRNEGSEFGAWDFVTTKWIVEDTAQAKLKDFVFTVHGGAEHAPWYEPDSTLFFYPGQPLTAPTMKIDNPKIYIDQPVASNLATDEKATYRIRLTNETEMTIPDYSTRNASSFVLRIKPNTNPNGANVYYNGSPLIEGLSLSLKPGTSMEGVIQLERVGDVYDFDSLVVQFFDQTYTLVSEQAISAHFVPTSSPIKMAQPASKWVMNTLSAKDETGYYIPVKLSDFDTNYANFDHIELQYKKHTEGDDRWVNQCSFFFDEELYDKANGNKELVTGRTIENIKFHGDMDPIEMEYDLRAVTFCRLGTGFVTRTSEVITGTKDTRAPEVFGMPKPTDGILTFEDVISIPFNEPIAYNYLDKTANFQVMGYTNNADQQYNTTATFVSNYSEAISQVTRNLTASDYTIDMMVQLNKSDFPIDLFRLKPENEQSSFVWEYWPEGSSNDPKWNDVFVLWVNNTAFVSQILASQNLSVSNAITHIGLSVNNGEPVFYVEGQTLNVRNVNDPKIKTGVKYDAKAEKISGNVIVGGYMSNGMKMADLRLWNKSLSSDEFVKYKAKHLSPTTPGLIGHWPMDEARGQVLHDEVNGADLTMEGMGWYLPEGEHSLHLDGKPVALESNKCYKFIRRDYEDYTLTFWYRINELTQQGNVPLFTAGSSHNDGQGIIVAHDGNHLKLLSNGNEFVISKVAADSAWHFVAVVANKSHNTVSLFHDNNLTEALSGNEVSGIANAFVQLGGNGFVGNLDCLTFWHVALTPNTIMQTYTTEPSGHEMELQYYLPFETNDRNDQNTIISVFSPCNQVYKLDREGNRLAPDTLFVATDAMADRKNFCPLRTLTGLENLPFNWTSTLNELQINIKKADDAINHQQLFVTVRNVEDLAGNTLANPEMLSLYVDRNVLTWDKREYIDTIRYGESTEFALQWTNACGKRLAYSIQNYNSWLTADVEMGEADPAGYGTVKFRVDQGLAPGEYTAFVYLVDENKLASPMYIKIIVKTEAPDWQLVDQQEYAFSMNLIGKVILSSEQTGSADDAIDQDTRDIVAAFYDGKCVGKTNINSKSKYNLFMTIYGNNAMLPKSSGKNKTDGAAIEFRLWRASTGHIEILESHDPNATDKAKDAVRFADQTVAGSTQNPVILRVTEQSIQQLNLKKGWNWISFNVEPTDVSSANKLFLDNEPFSQDDVLKFNDEFFSMYVDGIGWDNTSTDNSAHMNVAIGRTYKLYMHQAGTAYVQGSQISDEKRVITLQPGQWNNMAYLLRVDQPINTAMSSYLASKENEGSIIKSIDQFAVASVDGNETKWEGSLEYLHPGQGYYIYHAGKQEAKIYFSNDEVAAQSAPTRGSLEAETALQHSTSMPIVAAFAPQVEAEPTDQVYAYVGDELVGHASLIDCGGMGRRYFLSVNAEQGDQVTFAQVRDNEVIALCDATLSYDADQVVGTLDQPMLLNTTGHMVSVTPNVFTQYVDFTICTPGIDRLGSAIQICVYNAAGALVWEREVLASTSGLTRQRMDGSWLTPGVYVAKVMAGGRTESVRLIRK